MPEGASAGQSTEPSSPSDGGTGSSAAAPRRDTSPRVVVVGAGITGLATAWYLRGRAQVTVVEAGDRVGGRIRTDEVAGVPVDAGPDTFLARVPEAVELCREVGLGDDLVPPANTKAWVWTGGRLRRIPEPNVLGVPLALRPALRSGLVSRRGAARAALDLVRPSPPPASDDPSVAEVVGGRLGQEVLDRLVEPLVGGIHAGRADGLSLALTAPPLAAAARQRSLLLALRRAPTSPPGPVFLGLTGGMGRLPERLAEELSGCLRTGVRVTALEPATGGGWTLACEPGPDLEADAVVLTVPAFAAAPLLKDLCPDAADELAAIEHASVAVVTLGYPPAAVPSYLDGGGFLVPRVDGRLMTACTWTTSKWPELRRGGLILVRASVGRAGDDRAMAMDDDELVARLHTEMAEATGVSAEPVVTNIARWPRSFAQYAPGHSARLDRVEKALAALPAPLVLAGASYRGIGIASCVRQARQAAERVASSLPRIAPKP